MALLTLMSILLLGTAPAGAHDELIGTDPRDGATLDRAPGRITLTFSGDISDLGAQVAVTGAQGDDLAEGEPRVSGTEVEQDLLDVGPGAYTVLWRVTSQDGHPISGELSFAVAAGEEDDPVEDPTAAPSAAATTEAPAAAEATSDGTAPEDSSAGGTGLPVWVWVVLAIAVLGLVGLLAATVRRGRA